MKLYEEIEAAVDTVRGLIKKVNPAEGPRIAVAFTAEEQHLIDAVVSLNSARDIFKRADR